MEATEFSVVTGAFSYTGKYIAQRLLSMREEVRTLTGRHGRENPFSDQVKAFQFNFESPGELTESLRGGKTLYNTYWIRYPHGQASFDKAVANSETLIAALLLILPWEDCILFQLVAQELKMLLFPIFYCSINLGNIDEDIDNVF